MGHNKLSCHLSSYRGIENLVTSGDPCRMRQAYDVRCTGTGALQRDCERPTFPSSCGVPGALLAGSLTEGHLAGAATVARFICARERPSLFETRSEARRLRAHFESGPQSLPWIRASKKTTSFNWAERPRPGVPRITPRICRFRKHMLDLRDYLCRNQAALRTIGSKCSSASG